MLRQIDYLRVPSLVWVGKAEGSNQVLPYSPLWLGHLEGETWILGCPKPEAI